MTPKEKAIELFRKSANIKPHAPTFVAWAILEEELGMRAISTSNKSLAAAVPNMSIEGECDINFDNLDEITTVVSFMTDDFTPISTSTSSASSSASTTSSTGKIVKKADDLIIHLPKIDMPNEESLKYAQKQLNRARELFELGIYI